MSFTPLYIPLTTLDAVNQLLMSIGQSPVNTLEVTGLKTVNIAQQVLHNTLREVLTTGWDFNTDDDYTLTIDGDGKCNIPTNALTCDPCDVTLRYVERLDSATRRFYDKDNHTFVLSANVKVDIAWFFPFEQIPQCARAYVSARAGRRFQAQMVGEQLAWQYTEEHEHETLAELTRQEGLSRDTSMFDYGTDTNQIVFRDRNI